jgi:hypothetical protein
VSLLKIPSALPDEPRPGALARALSDLASLPGAPRPLSNKRTATSQNESETKKYVGDFGEKEYKWLRHSAFQFSDATQELWVGPN